METKAEEGAKSYLKSSTEKIPLSQSGLLTGFLIHFLTPSLHYNHSLKERNTNSLQEDVILPRTPNCLYTYLSITPSIQTRSYESIHKLATSLLNSSLPSSRLHNPIRPFLNRLSNPVPYLSSTKFNMSNNLSANHFRSVVEEETKKLIRFV